MPDSKRFPGQITIKALMCFFASPLTEGGSFRDASDDSGKAVLSTRKNRRLRNPPLTGGGGVRSIVEVETDSDGNRHLGDRTGGFNGSNERLDAAPLPARNSLRFSWERNEDANRRIITRE